MRERSAKGESTTREGALNSAPHGLTTAPLPHTAENILAAAQRVLLAKGYEGLAIRKVAREAGESVSLVMYHFGSKANLVAMLVDSLWHYADVEFAENLNSLPGDAATRLSALIDLHARFTTDPRPYRMYFELLPHIIHDRQAREILSGIYDSYRDDFGVRCLATTSLPAAQLRPLASLLLAVGEGLPAQTLLDPACVDVAATFDLLRTAVTQYAAAAATPNRGSSGPNSHADNVARDPRVGGPRLDSLFPRHPAAGLTPPARRLLTAARSIARRQGLGMLTFDRVAQVSGESRSSVSYYFGDKRALLNMLLDSVLWDCATAYRNHSRAVGPRSPVRQLIELLPIALRDDDMCRRLSALHGVVRANMVDGMLEGHVCSEGDCRAAAALTLAAVDGLVFQTLMDPRGYDPRPSLAILESLLVAAHLRQAPLAHSAPS
jgi:AcrR family transcriptional regulator